MEMNTFGWEDPVDPRIQVRKDRVAFFLASLALAATGLYSVALVVAMVTMDLTLIRFLFHPNWEYALELPLFLCYTFASFLFLSHANVPRRKVQVAIITITSLAGLGFWCADHALWLGFAAQTTPSHDDPFRTLVLRCLSLVRLVVLLDLAAPAITSKSREEVAALRKAAVAASVLGFGLWLLMSLEHVDWSGWPLRWMRMRDPNWFLIQALSVLARGVGSLVAAIVCLQACVSQTRELAELEAQSQANDPFRSQHPWN